jgi:DNA polymerase/3'-5' exonuclease PolX
MTGTKAGLSNAEIADRLASLAQLLSTQKENPYKTRAYIRAAAKIRTLSESMNWFTTMPI